MADLKTHRVPKTMARAYLGKAKEFLTVATVARDSGQSDAALLLAVHSGISACDAVSIALAGVRSVEPDHLRSADLLERVASQVEDVRVRATQLRGLLKLKNLVEYDDQRVSAIQADDGTKRAQRLAEWAAEQLVRANV